MKIPLAAQDTCFYSLHGFYNAKARAEMAAELGYSGVCPVLFSEPAWNEIGELKDHLHRLGLAMPSVWVCVDLAKDLPPRLPEALDVIADGDTLLEVSFRHSDHDGAGCVDDLDAAFVSRIEHLLDTVAKRGVSVSLYPHINFWLQRVEDAVALCERFAGHGVGISLPFFHWLCVHRRGLAEHAAMVRPHLRRLVVSGVTLRGEQPAVEPLDAGDADPFWFVATVLRETGFAGPASLLGFAVFGDVYHNLRRSITAWRDILRRTTQNADWADFHTDV